MGHVAEEEAEGVVVVVTEGVATAGVAVVCDLLLADDRDADYGGLVLGDDRAVVGRGHQGNGRACRGCDGAGVDRRGDGRCDGLGFGGGVAKELGGSQSGYGADGEDTGRGPGGLVHANWHRYVLQI